MTRSPAMYVLLLLTIFTSSGASCVQYFARDKTPLAPVVFVGPPTLNDVIYAVNTNGAQVRQLYTESASLSTPGAPSLRATIALERPRRFRLRAKLISQELDVGSNDELFWFWAKSDPERAIYYAYHQQFGANAYSQGLPIGPDWLIEAMGLIQLDPAGQHEGPVNRPDQKVEIRSRLDRNGTPYSRLLVVDGKHGWVLEQHLWDMSGARLASARCSDHRFYQDAGVSLPHRVHVELPTVQLSFQVEIGRFLVNQLTADPVQLWTRPPMETEGYQLVNIAEPTAPAQSLPYPETALDRSAYEPRTSYRPRYRGLGPVNR